MTALNVASENVGEKKYYLVSYPSMEKFDQRLFMNALSDEGAAGLLDAAAAGA